MKKLIVGIVIGIMICMTVFASPVGLYKGFETIKMILNGTEVKSETPAVLIDGRVYIPAQTVESANMIIYHDKAKNEVRISNIYKLIESNVTIDNEKKLAKAVYEFDKAGNVKNVYVDIETIRGMVTDIQRTSGTNINIKTLRPEFEKLKNQSAIATPTPTPTPSAQANPTDEGLSFITDNGIKYVSMFSVVLKHLKDGYNFGRETNGKFNFVRYNENGERKYLLRNISMKFINGDYYLTYDDYINKILPLIK